MNLNDLSDWQAIHKAEIQVGSNLSDLSQVLSWFDQFNHPPVPKYIWMQCQLAIAEGFTNAVRHAHRDKPPETPIEIEVAIFPQRLEIRIWDRGQPFDLKGSVADMPAQVDEEAVGGRGLKLLDRIADGLSYTQTEDQRNCLLIVKYYPQA
ncbi:anti-sigma regulatory factor [Microcoleus sp. FACHB-68]|uniref:ATP-binding protein n=1 Tax=Microcoleus sp. FACHB-68 TaxID=2692826 RepID=UPI001682785E|nr:anti-sigma regulatory factor [Microcoleus sp. FACHB-68]MBD1940699.1 anti-sigma regulatory factor [Microcoleus sp. FACHB-68]